MNRFVKKLIANSLVTALTLSSVLGLVAPTTALAATDPGLGAAASFSVLAQTAITDAGAASVITGDVGMNDFSSNITGLTAAQVGPPGLIYATDPVPVAPAEAVLDPAVQADALATYGVPLTGQPIEGTPIVGALDGQTRGSGVYDMGAILLAGGVFTLDGPGVYIFRSASSLTSAGSISLINGARACDVYWRIADDATINAGGPGTSFAGTILANTGIHFGAGAILDGRALAVGADVTMNTNTISGPSCATPPTPTPTPAPSNGSSGGSGSFLPTPTPIPTPTPTPVPTVPSLPETGVVVPGLPDTGIPPGGSSTLWYITFAGLLTLITASVVTTLRKRTN